MNFLVSGKYFKILSNARLAGWRSPELKVVTRWSVIIVGSTSAIVVTRRLMDMIISGL